MTPASLQSLGHNSIGSCHSHEQVQLGLTTSIDAISCTESVNGSNVQQVLVVSYGTVLFVGVA